MSDDSLSCAASQFLEMWDTSTEPGAVARAMSSLLQVLDNNSEYFVE